MSISNYVCVSNDEIDPFSQQASEPFGVVEFISCVVRPEDGGFIAENSELNIIGSGKNEQEAIDDFYASLNDTWDGLKAHTDVELTQDAIELREKLAGYFHPACDAKG